MTTPPDKTDASQLSQPDSGATAPVPTCPKCGSTSLRHGKVPISLGFVGKLLTQPAICNTCEHEFDYNKPHADWKSRSRNLWLAINAVGAVGIVVVVLFLGSILWDAWKGMK